MNVISIKVMKHVVVLVVLLLSIKGYATERKDSLSILDRVHAIDELIVTGTRHETETRKLPLTITILSKEEIEGRYQASLLPVLTEQVPGLFITSRGVMGYGVANGASGTMNMRGIGGSPTTGMQVLVDGVPQTMGLMGHPIADIYQSMLAERVEVVRGPASVLYGSNAMGGVINVVTPKFTQDSSITKAQISYGAFNTLETSVFNRYQKDKLSSKVSASYSRSDGHRENLDFDQYSLYAKLGYKLSEHWASYADFNLTHFNASNPGAIDALLLDNDSEITRGMSALTLENKYDYSSGALKVFYNWGKHWINDGYAVGATPLDYRFNSEDIMAGASLFQSVSLFADNYITFGADYFHFGGKAWNQFTDNRVDLSDVTADEWATYVDIRQSIGDFLSLDAGLRYDYHSQSGGQWIPQGGLSMYFSNAMQVKAMVSKGFRNPTLKDLYMFRSQNPDLLPESILNYELSLSQTLLHNKLKYSLNVFYLEGDNMIQTVFVDGRPLNVNTGEVENRGMEMALSYKLNNTWSSSMNYSYLAMKYPVLAAPEHKFYADLNYAKNKLSLSSGVQYVAGLYLSTMPEERESFWLWNARASYHMTSSWQSYLRVENLLNQTYQINKGFSMPGTTLTIGVKYQL